jgi:hypothetical protein
MRHCFPLGAVFVCRRTCAILCNDPVCITRGTSSTASRERPGAAYSHHCSCATGIISRTPRSCAPCHWGAVMPFDSEAQQEISFLADRIHTRIAEEPETPFLRLGPSSGTYRQTRGTHRRVGQPAAGLLTAEPAATRLQPGNSGSNLRVRCITLQTSQTWQHR